MATLRKTLKIVNFILGVTLAAMGVCQMIFGQIGNFIFFLMPGYLVLFGLMTVAGDFEIKIILKFCGFLGNFFGRGVFNIYCGANMLMTYEQFTGFLKLISMIAAFVFLVSGVILIGLGFYAKKNGNTSLTSEVGGYLDKNNQHAESPETA